MGAVNYGSNNIINIGLNVNDVNISNDEINLKYDEVFWLLEEYDFYFLILRLKEGYYTGFYLDLELCLDEISCYLDKLDAQKELTQLKELLIKCIDIGLVKYSPGYCTGYYSAEESKKAVKEVIKRLRKVIKYYDL